MRPLVLLPRMRALPLIVLLALAGCVDVPDDASADPTPDDAMLPVEPFAAEGAQFLPPSQSQDRVETLIPFPVNATGSAIAASFALGSRYGPADAPPILSDVVVQLRAPDGSVLEESSVTIDMPEAQLDAEANATGEYALALLSYGGSDGEANGDYVAWRVDVAPP